jgi:hypothetical protein
MALRANVASIEVLDRFRADLLVYVAQARSALEEVSADAMRLRLWLQTEQRVHWEAQMRRRQRALEQAQQELFSARLSNLTTESAAQQMAVHRARRAVEEAEGKLRMLRLWDRDFDNRVQPLVKQMEKLHTLLTNDMVKAAAFLNESVKTLAAYAQITPAAVPAVETGSAGPDSTPGVAPAGAAPADDTGAGKS